MVLTKAHLLWLFVNDLINLVINCRGNSSPIKKESNLNSSSVLPIGEHAKFKNCIRSIEYAVHAIARQNLLWLMRPFLINLIENDIHWNMNENITFKPFDRIWQLKSLNLSKWIYGKPTSECLIQIISYTL